MTHRPFVFALVLAGNATVASAATFTVTNDADVGAGSLRQAILDANAAPGADIIAFAIPATGAVQIGIRSALPAVTEPLTIDGTTQPGWAGAPLVELVTGRASRNYGGFTLTGGGSVIRSLAINPASGIVGPPAILIQGPGGNRVTGCFLGVAPDGTTGREIANVGIRIEDSTDNVIGGTLPADRNVVAGTTVEVAGPGATRNRIRGNFIGFDGPGTVLARGDVVIEGAPGNEVGGGEAGAGNRLSGVRLAGGGASNNVVRGNWVGALGPAGRPLASGKGLGLRIEDSPANVVGGAAVADRNVIAANLGAGVRLTGLGATGNVVLGNWIGLDATGVAAANNTGLQIDAGAARNRIGGGAAGTGNVISGNSEDGLAINGSADNEVFGNRIGTALDGMTAVPNGTGGRGYGVSVGINAAATTTGNRIGGPLPGEGNQISGNLGFGGLVLFGVGTSNNVVQGNAIGSDATRKAGLGNAGPGIYGNSASSNLIGGPLTSGGGNVIGWNGTGAAGGAGVLFAGGGGNLVQGNLVVSNRGPGVAYTGPVVVQETLFAGNTGINIDRGNDGPTPNVPGSARNAPEITAVKPGSVLVEGGVDIGMKKCTVTIEVTVSGDAPDFPKTYSEEVHTEDTTSAFFSIHVPGDFSKAKSATATATVLFCAEPGQKETSEQSLAFVIKEPCPSLIVWMPNELPEAVVGKPYPAITFSSDPPGEISRLVYRPRGPRGIVLDDEMGKIGTTGAGGVGEPGEFTVEAEIRVGECYYKRTYTLRVRPQPPVVELDPESPEPQITITYDGTSAPVRLESSSSLSPAVWNFLAEDPTGRLTVPLKDLGDQRFFRVITKP